MLPKYSPLAVLLLCVFALPTVPKEDLISVDGPVLAIQRDKDDTRVIDPNSMGDLAEIFMVRADRWSEPRKEKYIIVEYIHRANLISYGEFDQTLWTFEVHQASSEESKDCHSWMARGPSFIPTAFGAKERLPKPETLPCFLTTKRPVPASRKLTTH